MKTDARVRYTKMAIRKAFSELISKEPLSKITVTKICEKAEINRATFYKHYEDVYDLEKKLEEEFFAEMKENLLALETDGFYELNLRILQLISDNLMLVATLSAGQRGFSERVLEECYSFFLESRKEMPDGSGKGSVNDRYYYSYLSYGAAGIVRAWMTKERDVSIEETAQAIVDLTTATTRGMRLMESRTAC